MGSQYQVLIAICLYLLINKVDNIDHCRHACKSMHADEHWASVVEGQGGDTLLLHKVCLNGSKHSIPIRIIVRWPNAVSL